jgi:BR serine/threonine kinase
LSYDGKKADIWSCGVVLFALITGTLPFDDENIRKLLQKVKTGAFTFPKFVSSVAQDLIRKMMSVSPDDRLNVSSIR